MSNVDPTSAILLVGRCILAYYGFRQRRLPFVAAAVTGVFARMHYGGHDRQHASHHLDHLPLNVLSCTKNPVWLQAAVGVLFFITHCDHHALYRVPLGALVGGYVCGSFGTDACYHTLS